jgi:hypothetical protein
MKTIADCLGGQFEFPETKEEAAEWEPMFVRRALHPYILCVAKTRIEGKWAAYILPVAGMNHDEEWLLWTMDGEKLPEDVARVLFPLFGEVPYAR